MQTQRPGDISRIEQNVMASVAAIHTGRVLTGTTALKLYISILALWSLGQLVFVQRVVENFKAVGLDGAFNFFLTALTHTDLWVQLMLAAFVIAAVLLVRDIARLSSGPRQYAL
jgi:hypothetical protein